MIRQARSYLAGAVSGTVLIAVALVAVVVFVSAQAFKSWPIAGLSDGKEKVSVEAGRPASPATSVGVASPATDRTGVEGGAKGPAGEESSAQAPAIAHQENTGSGGGASNGTPAGSTNPGGDSGSSPAPSNGSGGSGSSGGGSNSSQSKPATPSPSTVVTDTVNEAVKGVDETLDGTLSETPIPKATQGITEGLTGPTSPVGQVLDETAGAVEDLLTPRD